MSAFTIFGIASIAVIFVCFGPWLTEMLEDWYARRQRK